MKNSQKVGGSGSAVIATSLARSVWVTVSSKSAGYVTRNGLGISLVASGTNSPSTAFDRSRIVTAATSPASTAA